MQTLTSWLMKYRFPILCISIFVVMSLRTGNGQWGGDFWEHSAVVRELATHILQPKHPQLLLDAPHAFYSPYAVLVALLARVLHSDAVTALSIMGLINLGLLFLGLRVFVFSMVPKNRSATAFYTLLLTLFFWGSAPWHWSCFFHIGQLGHVIPYPSTFAAALTLIALGVNKLRIGSRRQILLVPLFLIAVTVLISHPITFFLLVAGLVSQSCAEKGSVLSQLALVGGLLGLVFLVAAFWPYFPVVKFFMGESSVFNASNRLMYQQVVRRIWPSLIGVPLIIAGLRSNWRRPLALMTMILLAIYAFGAISGKYSYGRVIAYIVLLFHVAIAERLSMLESAAHGIRAPIWLRQLILPLIVMAPTMVLSPNELKNTFEEAFLKPPPTDESYLFLSRFTGQYEVVLSDIVTSWIVPTFGGKVVAADHPLAFVPDQDVRRSDLARFFNQEASPGERQQIIRKYKTDYLLFRKSEVAGWRDLQQSLLPQGRRIFESDSFVLISLKPDPGKDAAPFQRKP